MIQVLIELEFQWEAATTFRLVGGAVTRLIQPNTTQLVNLFLPRGEGPVTWHYSLLTHPSST